MFLRPGAASHIRPTRISVKSLQVDMKSPGSAFEGVHAALLTDIKPMQDACEDDIMSIERRQASLLSNNFLEC